MSSVLLKRQDGGAIRVKDLIAVLERANPDALVFVRHSGFLVMPGVQQVTATSTGAGLYKETPGSDELPSVLID